MAEKLVQKGEVRGEFTCIRGEATHEGGVMDISLWQKQGSDRLWLTTIDGEFFETEELVVNYL